jgi:hypothetical protein
MRWIMYASTEHKQPRCNGEDVSEKKSSGHWDTFNKLEQHLNFKSKAIPLQVVRVPGGWGS